MEEGLTLQQERFCINYAQNKEFFGNATLSYSNAYDKDYESEPDDDAIYRLADGKEVSQYELELLKISNKSQVFGAEIIEKSSKDKMYDYCAMAGSRLIRNDKIQVRIRALLNEMMKDDVIDARLIEIIMKGNDADSLRALQEYNKLKQRIVTKVDHTSKGNEIKGNTIVFADFTGDDSTTEN